MPDAGSLLKRVHERAEQGFLTDRDVALLEDVAAGENPGWEKKLAFATQYLPEPTELPEVRTRPGLLADSHDIDLARERLREDSVSKAVWEALEQICRSTMSPDDPGYVEFEERKQSDIWGKRGGHWVLANAVEHLAWAYRISGDREYGEYARGILLAIARSRHGWGPLFCNYGTPYKGWLMDNSLDLGHATLTFAVCYDLIDDLLSEDDRQAVADYYEPYFHRLTGLRYECVPHLPANSPIIGHCGVGLMALSLADAYPARRRGVLVEAVRSARAYAHAGLDGAIAPDGACVEGSGYSSASMHYLAMFSEGLRRCCGIDLFAHPTWTANPRYLCCEMLPGGGAINNYNDNHFEGVTTGYWLMVSARTGDPTGRWVWENYSGPRGSGNLHRGRGTLELPYVLLHRDPEAPEVSPEGLGVDPVHHFDALHHLVMRTGWAPEDTHVTFQCTPHDPDRHAHGQADRLNFTAYALGERLAIDSGYGLVPIAGSTQVKRLGKLGESHNQVLVDGAAQQPGLVGDGIPGGSRIERWERKDEWVWAVGEATAFWPRMRSVRRAIATRLNARDPLILVVDLVVPESGQHTFEWLLHTEEGNRFELRDGSVDLQGHRCGGRVQILQRASTEVRWRQDEWISHPRLKGSSRGTFLVALTAIGAFTESRAEADGSELRISWGSSAEGSQATVTWQESEGLPVDVSVGIDPSGVAFDLAP